VDLGTLAPMMPVVGTCAWLVYKWMHLRLIRHALDQDGIDAAVKLAEATRTDPAEIAKAIRGEKSDAPSTEQPKSKSELPPDTTPPRAA
jgi:hypothetical protein